MFVFGLIWNVVAPVCACHPRLCVGVVAAERRPEHGGNIDPVVESLVEARLGSSHPEAFGSTVVVDAVLFHHTLGAPLHPVPASFVEGLCLWNDVGQGEGRLLVFVCRCVRTGKNVTPVEGSVGSVVRGHSLVVVGLVLCLDDHVLVGVFVLEL